MLTRSTTPTRGSTPSLRSWKVTFLPFMRVQTTSGSPLPLRLRCDEGELRLITTLTSFATAVDVTLAEMQLEAFLPADQWSADYLRRAQDARRDPIRLLWQPETRHQAP